jgi:hypothetical protein
VAGGRNQACALQRTPRNNLAEKARNGVFVITNYAEIILLTRAHARAAEQEDICEIREIRGKAFWNPIFC